MRKSVIAALTMGVLIAVAAFRVVDQWRIREQLLQTAEARASNLTVILAEYIQESFVSGDSALRQIALHSRRIGGPGAPDAEWAPSLASAQAGLRGIGSLSVVDANGIIRHSTQPAIVGQSRSDRFAFRELKARDTDSFVVDTPFMSVVEPKVYLIPIGRRLTRADGSFDGIIVATFYPGVPRGFLGTVDVGKRGTVWMFHPDGVVLFREPSSTNPMGEPATANPVFVEAKRARNRSVSWLNGPIGASTLVASHAIATPPLIAAVTLDEWEILQDYRRQVIGAVLFFTVLTSTLAVILLVLFRQMDAKAAVEQSLRRALELESERLRETNDELEAASALKDQFLMTVSHELRTPLTAIHGWVRMLISGQVTDDHRLAALESIERNARMQTRLVDDLLDVSRVIGGKLRLDVREVEIADVVHAAVSTVAPAADARGIRLEARLDPSLPAISADPDRLQQIIWNLLSNAVKFTPVGGTVNVRADRDGHALVIRVSDSGAGISPAFLPHVFERFRQQEGGTRRQHGGLGLGLAIVRHLTEMHGGSVSAESDGEGKGATFIVRLPLNSAASKG